MGGGPNGPSGKGSELLKKLDYKGKGRLNCVTYKLGEGGESGNSRGGGCAYGRGSTGHHGGGCLGMGSMEGGERPGGMYGRNHVRGVNGGGV